MLDYFAIFTKGGALLWTLQFAALKHSPVEALNSLIRACLLEEKSGDTGFTYYPKSGAAQSLKWTFHNGLGLVFVAVYQKTLSLLYVDELLQRVKQEFVPKYKPNLYEYAEFDDVFQKLLRDCESNAEAAKRGLGSKPTSAMSAQANTRGAMASRAAKGGSSGGKKSKGASSDDGDAAANGRAGAKANGDHNMPLVNVHADAAKNNKLESATSDEDRSTVTSAKSGAFDVSKLSKSHASRGRGGRVPKKEDKPAKKEEPTAPKKKAPRRWDTTSDDQKEPGKLDYSNLDAEDEAVTGASSDSGSASGSEFPLVQSHMDDEEEDYEEDEEEIAELEREVKNGGAAALANGKAGPKRSGVLGSFMSRLAMNVVGKGALTEADIRPALVEMKKKLMERNVAEAIAEKVCSSVGAGLEGKKLSSFTGLSTFVKSAFEEALSGILNKRQTDVLLDIQAARARGKPFVIVFCGVNGVGKSTNLAKICYWLLQHNCKPMIAACDTFRAGAVEQLKTHCTRLKVPLYERGYEKDPAKVAAEAVKQAARDGRDVVLVDTAGRMQDNEPLMRALSNLINLNNPNLVLFVGEALVGNDAVDQLVKFNRALHDLSPPNAIRRHCIDGIVLTKFDTIDDKVGAAVSMVYASGAPVMFVGCGQTYVDLKKLNVKSVVKALLS